MVLLAWGERGLGGPFMKRKKRYNMGCIAFKKLSKNVLYHICVLMRRKANIQIQGGRGGVKWSMGKLMIYVCI